MIVGLVLCQPVQGQEASRVVLPGETAASARRLAAADKLAAEQQWAEALEEYQRLLEEAGDELVPLTPRLSVPARRLCQQRLAGLPAAARRHYRGKVDAQADHWLKQWESARDPRLLRRIVDEAFASRAGADALDRLGDLAFERGAFAEAEQWWHMLAPLEPRSSDLVPIYPDPAHDVARIHAKQILARLSRGDRAADARVNYRKTHAPATGALAGLKGRYADILDQLAEQQPAADETGWPTFAGAPSRQRILEQPPGRLDHRAPLSEPTWSWPLTSPPERDGKVRPLGAPARAPAFHPVIVGDQVLIADARRVTAFDLRTGQRAVWYDLVDDGQMGGLALALKRHAAPDQRYTLTVADDRVYVRLGAPALGPREKNTPAGGHDSFLVCLTCRPDRDGTRVCWPPLKANITETSTAQFEGAPVVRDGLIFIAVTRFDAATTTAIACFDAASGAPRWRRPVDVCEVQERGSPRSRQHLLTLAGAKVVYCAHAGVVAALEADTGRRAWAARYPSRGDRGDDGQPSPRDLCPCVYAADRLFVAPADHDRILCLDPETGRLLWESTPALEVVHVLGVARNRLLVATPHDLRALDIATGQTLRHWLFPDDSVQLPSFGRGLLAGDWVLWPTVNGLRVLDQESGQPVARVPYNFQPNQLRGNLAAGNGCLVVADTEQLHAFVPPGRFLDQRRRDARRDPDSAAARYALARAESDAGLHDSALISLHGLERHAHPRDQLHGVSLRTLARQRRHELLLDLAQQGRARRRWDESADRLRQAAHADFAVAERLIALSRLAALEVEANRPAQAVAAWQAILQDDALRQGRLDEQPAGAHAARHIDDLIRAHGLAVYAAVEQQAGRLHADAVGERPTATLERLVREYPNARATSRARQQLAAGHAKAGQAGAAARLYRLALQHHDADRAASLAGLARAYDRQGCRHDARSTWQRLARDFGDRVEPALDPQRPLNDFVALQLRQPAYRDLDDPRPMLRPPLTRTWHAPLDDSPARLLVPAADGVVPDGLLFVQGTGGTGVNLSFRAAPRNDPSTTGKERWRRTLPRAPIWAGRHADLLVLAGARGLLCLSVSDGVTLWEWSGDEQNAFRHCQVSAGRLFLMDGERRLLAIDIETGLVLWRQWAPGAELRPLEPSGRFHPLYHAGAQRLVLQTAAGRLWVLDSQTGRKLHDVETTSTPWMRPPRVLSDRLLCLVIGTAHLVMFDPVSGKELWRRPSPKASVSGEAPWCVGDVNNMLVLSDGWQLERLDPRSGESRWQVGQPRWLERGSAVAWESAHDDGAVYFVRRNVLHARALEDGRPLWELQLPGPTRPWRTRRTQSHLLVHPLGQVPRPATLVGGYLLAFPLDPHPAAFPLLICDPATGQVAQRLNFPMPTATVQLLDGALAIASTDQAWILGAAPRP